MRSIHSLRNAALATLIAAGIPASVFAGNDVMTETEQKSLTPDAALAALMAGNERFTSGQMLERDLLAQVRATSGGQYPAAAVLSCVDSRVPVETVFDQGIGDVFVARVAGNVEDEHLLASLEFAAAVAGSKMLLILGHENCGAVKGAIAGADLGHLPHLLGDIEPAIESVEARGLSADDPGFLDEVIAENVRLTLRDIRARSEILSGMESRGEIRIVGAIYSLSNGSVTLLD